MSKGSHKRRSDGVTPNGDGGRQVWLIVPSRESHDQEALREETRRRAEALGLKLVVRRAELCVVEGGPEAHRRFELLTPRDAGDLYYAAHRKSVLVLALMSCYVRLDPSENPTRRRHLRRLDSFVRYKASYGLARSIGDPKRLIDGFESWPDGDQCSGDHDPRALPLHVFDSQKSWDDLDTEAGYSGFVTAYGSGSRRLDCDGRDWVPAPVGHGSDTLTISGYRLTKGFHWDVCRGRGRSARLVTSHEVWLLRSRNSYANVYPDAFVRGAPRGNVKLVWPSRQ